ncbi:hypothetical protein [Thiothrix lacustris]|uniref:hypothetical protein n=1 Tax=Thiothrix lacustris TaxID=525917 RepID=UPI00048EECDB|nr:hypothetical protein [Thiothrix lacustris]
MDDSQRGKPYRELSEQIDRISEKLKPFRELSERIERITEPSRRLTLALQPFMAIAPYRHANYKANCVPVPEKSLLPQQSKPPTVTPKPPSEKHQSTLDKNAERLKIYEEVVQEFGRYAQRGVLLDEAAKRAGCSVDSIKRAIGIKK